MCDPEKKLLMEVADGNENAFRTLFELYHHQLGRYVFRITQSRELAEEIVQDVYLKVWVNRESLRGVACFKAYLFVASKNHALNYLRKLAREKALRYQLEADYPDTIPQANAPDKRYYRLLDEAIDRLPPQQQKVYLLSRHQRLKYDEIAAKLDLSRETVKSYLKLATASITAYMTSHADVVAYSTIFLFLI